MARQQVSWDHVAEWEVLATMAQGGEWVDLKTAWLRDPVARWVYDRMVDAKTAMNDYSPTAVGVTMRGNRYPQDQVDAAVGMLADTARTFSQTNISAVVGYVIERAMVGSEPLDIVSAKHSAGCQLTDADIEALKRYAGVEKQSVIDDTPI